MKSKITAILTAILLSACAVTPPLNINDPTVVELATKVTKDNYSKMTKVESPQVRRAGAYTEDYYTVTFISAASDGKGEAALVYFGVMYADDWRRYDTAHDSDGNELPVKVIARDVVSCRGSTCSLSEQVNISVDRKYLEAHASSGIDIQVSARGRSPQVIKLPAAYVQGVLSAMSKNGI